MAIDFLPKNIDTSIDFFRKITEEQKEEQREYMRNYARKKIASSRLIKCEVCNRQIKEYRKRDHERTKIHKEALKGKDYKEEHQNIYKRLMEEISQIE